MNYLRVSIRSELENVWMWLWLNIWFYFWFQAGKCRNSRSYTRSSCNSLQVLWHPFSANSNFLSTLRSKQKNLILAFLFWRCLLSLGLGLSSFFDYLVMNFIFLQKNSSALREIDDLGMYFPNFSE
jgi:hypothetical protein